MFDKARLIAEIATKDKRLAAQHHPDRGGDPAAMAELNQARDEALKEIAS